MMNLVVVRRLLLGVAVVAGSLPTWGLSGDIIPFISSYSGQQIAEKKRLPLQSAANIQAGDDQWELSIHKKEVPGSVVEPIREPP